MVSLELPWPMSVNHYWGTRRRGGKFLKPEGLAYRTTVRVALLQAKARKMLGQVWMVIDGAPPDLKRRDLDNLLKVPLDALQHGGLYDDDFQISWLTIRRLDPHRPTGLMSIRVYDRGNPLDLLAFAKDRAWDFLRSLV